MITRSNNPLPNPMSCKCKAIAQRRVYVASIPGLPSQVFANWKAWERRSERAGTLVMYVGKQDTICKLRPISNIRSILTIHQIPLHFHVWRSRVTTAYNSAMHNHKKCQMIQTRPLLPLFISLVPWVSISYSRKFSYNWPYNWPKCLENKFSYDLLHARVRSMAGRFGHAHLLIFHVQTSMWKDHTSRFDRRWHLSPLAAQVRT